MSDENTQKPSDELESNDLDQVTGAGAAARIQSSNNLKQMSLGVADSSDETISKV